MTIISMDLYLVTSGTYRMAFVSSQVATVTPCPLFEPLRDARPGLLAFHEGLWVIHPGWFWGEDPGRQPPRFLLILLSGTHALAVETCQPARLPVQPPPLAFTGQGVVFGTVVTNDGLTPVLDLARVPLA